MTQENNEELLKRINKQEENLKAYAQKLNELETFAYKLNREKVDVNQFMKLNNQVIELKLENKRYFEEIIAIQKEAREDQKQLFQETINQTREENNNKEQTVNKLLNIIIKFSSVGVGIGVIGLAGKHADKLLSFLGL
ncbi:hypothetical protein NSS82_19010 [Paenibacillus sp. FSL H7-0735]|uniref:hypothetical protein n=1 Tax=Paenibacillus sp. FSL H7-0735 TaxID=2954736 RepID=UPI0030FD130E